MMSKSHNLLLKEFQNLIDNITNDPDAFFIIYNNLNDYTMALFLDYNQ